MLLMDLNLLDVIIHSRLLLGTALFFMAFFFTLKGYEGYVQAMVPFCNEFLR